MFLFSRKRKPQYSIATGEVDGMQMVGHYDLSLRKFKAKSKYPYMLGISIQGFETDDRKLPTNVARAAIDKFEDEIISLVEKNSEQIYVGHSFWRGALEVIFYIAEWEKLVTVLEARAKIAEKEKGMWFTFKVDADAEWSQLEGLTQS